MALWGRTRSSVRSPPPPPTARPVGLFHLLFLRRIPCKNPANSAASSGTREGTLRTWYRGGRRGGCLEGRSLWAFNSACGECRNGWVTVPLAGVQRAGESGDVRKKPHTLRQKCCE